MLILDQINVWFAFLTFTKSKVPSEPKAFYLRPLEKVPSDFEKPWYISIPVGIYTLNRMVASHYIFSGVHDVRVVRKE